MKRIPFKIFIWLNFMSIVLCAVISCKKQTYSPNTHAKTRRFIQFLVDSEEERAIQMAVDEGHQPWRLDSITVAIVAVEGVSNEKIEDQNCEKVFEKNEISKVYCRGEHNYFVQLKKIIRPDGIWTAISLDIK